MHKLRVLSGRKVIAIFERFGFLVVYTKGSHAKLVRRIGTEEQVLVVPLHQELDKGTQRAIYKQALAYVSEKDIGPFFYSG
jgi:predicted RNA binding protein YcfA (HicA-like mRNA interferase family)